jgi:hypothetical protein
MESARGLDYHGCGWFDLSDNGDVGPVERVGSGVGWIQAECSVDVVADVTGSAPDAHIKLQLAPHLAFERSVCLLVGLILREGLAM